MALFTGLIAKEAIVGTVNSLYATMDMTGQETTVSAEEGPGGVDVEGAVTEAFSSVGEGLVGIISSFDVLGLGLVTEDRAGIAEEIGAETAVLQHIAAHFTIFSAFAYLLFVLMYFPCLAVIGAARQEMGGYYAGVMAVYSTLLAWSVATLFYQIVEGRSIFYALLFLSVLGMIYGGLHLIGKKERKETVPVFAPPIRKSCCAGFQR